MALSVAEAMEAGFLPALDEELADPGKCKSRHLIPTSSILGPGPGLSQSTSSIPGYPGLS